MDVPSVPSKFLGLVMNECGACQHWQGSVCHWGQNATTTGTGTPAPCGQPTGVAEWAQGQVFDHKIWNVLF